MTSVKTTLFAAALFAGFGISSASALPIGNLDSAAASTTPHVDQVRMVCNQWGHCWWRPNYYGAYGYGWHHGWWHHRSWARRHYWRYGRPNGW